METPGTSNHGFSVRFWGVRGSLPVSGRRTLRYGGNTTCLEIRAGEHLIIIDCGSGAYGLGADILKREVTNADLLMTHAHLDHVIGFPFFYPAYDRNFRLRCWSGRMSGTEPMENVLRTLTSKALSPVGLAAVDGCEFQTFAPGDAIELAPGLIVSTTQLNHPGGAVGFRIEYRNRAIAIITDHEHGDREIDAAVHCFVRAADIMIYDAAFTEEEYEAHRGWGHSTWQQAVALAEAADVRIPVLFHHLPDRGDTALDDIIEAARRRLPGTVAAKEGMQISADE